MIDGYALDLPKCEEVLRQVQLDAEGLSTALDGIEAIITAAMAGTGQSPVVAEAIGVFFDNRAPLLKGLGTRVLSAMTGTTAAIGWYNAGDDEMRIAQQALASEVATTGRFDQFVMAP